MKEFKLDAVNLTIEQDYTRSEVARSRDIKPSMLERWVKKSVSGDEHVFRGSGELTPEQKEINMLKAQMKRLQTEIINGFTPSDQVAEIKRH